MYVEKDLEGSLRKCGIIRKQCLLRESKKEAVLCIPSICHSNHRECHPYDLGNRVSWKNSELIFDFIKRKEKKEYYFSTCHWAYALFHLLLMTQCKWVLVSPFHDQEDEGSEMSTNPF